MCDQFQLILTMPATLKIMEKARKYHFYPSQFTFTPRKNSTVFLLLTSFSSAFSFSYCQRNVSPGRVKLQSSRAAF